MIQFILAISGLTSLLMATGRSYKMQRWAGVVGLCGQPAWLYYSWSHDALGLLVLSLAYSVVYIRAILIQFRSLKAVQALPDQFKGIK